LKRDGPHSEKVDSWGLGLLLYLLVTGKKPNNGTEPQIYITTVFKKTKFKQKAWKQCNPAALDLAQNLMQKDPSLRLSVSEILEHEWL